MMDPDDCLKVVFMHFVVADCGLWWFVVFCGGLWCVLWCFVMFCSVLWWFVVFSITRFACRKADRKLQSCLPWQKRQIIYQVYPVFFVYKIQTRMQSEGHLYPPPPSTVTLTLVVMGETSFAYSFTEVNI